MAPRLELEPPELLLAIAVAFLAGPYLLEAFPLQGALPVLGALLAAALAVALIGPRLRYGREGKPSANDGVPGLVRSHVVVPEGGKEFSLGILVKRSDDPHPASVVIYHVERKGYAARHHAELKVGSEILAVNKHRVKGSASHATDMIDHSLAKYGKVTLLCSTGERRVGSSYVVGKMPMASNGAAQSIPQDAFEAASDTDSTVDGLELEEHEGCVRVVSHDKRPESVFAGLRLNKGDVLVSIDGCPIGSIRDARKALIVAAESNHILVPILTYNVFRRLRSKVMEMTMSSVMLKLARGAKRSRRTSTVGQVRIEDKYKIGGKLGEGAFAVVHKGTHKSTGTVYAIKIINRRSLNKDVEAALQDEISILRDLDHEHIYRLDDVVATISKYYLVTEYLEGGELFDRIVAKSAYTESEARDVCRTLFSALQYMDSKGVAHRDLKPENLLLQDEHDDLRIKIADFGFAKVVRDGPDGLRDRSLRTMCGSPGYIAPEILRRDWYGTKADMFSMGVIVFILLGGYPPFYSENRMKLLKLTMRGQFEFDRDYWGHISKEVKNMIRSLLGVDPYKRPSADEVLSHPWMKESKKKLRTSDLAESQAELKKYQARLRFKKAIHSILFVNTFTGENAVFSGANKRKNVKALEEDIAELGE